jgi:tetratricopeptide (TPR) repeat protein
MIKTVHLEAAPALWFLCICLTGGFFFTSADGLTGEYLSTSRWRDLHSRYSPLANPAFLTEEDYLSVRMCEALVLNTFTLTEMGVVLPVGVKQSFGISYFGEGDGSIVHTNWQDSLTTTLSNRNNLFMVSYANNLWKRLSIGGNYSFSYATNFGDAVTSSAVDVGASYRLLRHPRFGEHLVGLTLQNILSPARIGQLSYTNNVKLSWLAYFLGRQIESGFDVDSKNMYQALAIDKTSKHIEYSYSFRLGCWLLRALNLYLQAGSDYFGFAGGVNFPQMNGGRDFSLLYQFMSLTEADAASSHSVYLRVQLGKHRKDVNSLVMNLSPSDLYNKACKLYYAGKYWDAFFIFSQILVQYPAFFKNDWVSYYRASCLEFLDMRNKSKDAYAAAKNDYPKSGIVPYADLGLMRIYYREDNPVAVHGQFLLLDQPGVPDSLKHHAYYLIGETFLKEKDYEKAVQAFTTVPETHPEYIFAQHSLAVVNVRNANLEGAINALGNCIEAKVQTKAQNEAINRSYVLLGYIFYEQLALSKAVTALRRVPKSSYYYEDALLGLSWSGLRARQWNDCILLGQSLETLSSKTPLQCEGGLVQGYAYLMLKNYDKALEVLQIAQKKAHEVKSPYPDTLENARMRYQVNRNDYALLAYEVDTMSRKAYTYLMSSIIDSLHRVQEGQRKPIDAYYIFAQEFSRQSFFCRNIDEIKSDVDYVSAIVHTFVRYFDNVHMQEKSQTQEDQINQEIKDLQKKMDKLNPGQQK